MKLVLFDIDGTLLHCNGRTREPLARALEQTFGTYGFLLGTSFSGKTDDQIVFEALSPVGLREDQIVAALPDLKSRYIELLDGDLDGAAVELLPGTVETLDRLAAQETISLGLLTGNWEVGARWKLAHFDLNRYFAVGVFGDGCRDRAVMPPLVVEAARRRLGQDFESGDVLIVGDTPNDVRCGRENRIKVAAVTTGFASRDELQAAGADWVFRDLVDAQYLLPLLVPSGEHHYSLPPTR